MKNILLYSFTFLLAFGAWKLAADLPAAPPDGMKDLGVSATVKLGSVLWDVDKDALLKEAPRRGPQKDNFAIHTSVKAPWLIIELPALSNIKKIYIQNRVESDPNVAALVYSRANGLTVWTSSDGNSWKQVWKASTPAGAEWNIDLNASGVRFLKIGLPERTKNYLHLNRVRIYGN